MRIEIKIPAVGESISEATIAQWLKKNGDQVHRDEVLLTLETDKANVEVVAEQDGMLEIKEESGAVVPIGSVVGFIETSKTGTVSVPKTPAAATTTSPSPPMTPSAAGTPPPARPAMQSESNGSNRDFSILVPAVGESITEGTIAAWLKKNGDTVKRDEVLLSLETDKATVDIVAEHAGILEIQAPAGSVVQIGSVVGKIRSSGQSATTTATSAPTPMVKQPSAQATEQEILSPAVRRIVGENQLNAKEIPGTGRGGRITKADADTFAEQRKSTTASVAKASLLSSVTPPSGFSYTVQPSVSIAHTAIPANANSKQNQRRVKMTTIRKRIAERLVMAQRTAAILTTFNEIRMTDVMALRARYKDSFKERYGVGLGFMSLFIKACIEGLRAYPEVNAFIENDEIVYNDTFNIGVAVGGPKGLLVPVLHNAERASLADIELRIKEYAEKARAGKITIEDLSGGTFTISNGGTYGSLMSTPILNPPQSGILGMHKIEERPIAVNGKVEIHPMMYVALSYDHRIIDGEGAVKFLVKVKECLEDPNRILLEI